MEYYIVIAKRIEAVKDKFTDYRIQKFVEPPPAANTELSKPVIPAGYEQVFGPASLDACVNYIRSIDGNQIDWHKLTVWQYWLIGLVTLIFVVVVGWGAIKLYGSGIQNPLELIKKADDSARILITFLVAVATVAIAFLATLTAMLIREYKERFAQAKEVLTILVGILGTIVGFYFGTANTPPPGGTPTPTATASPSNTNSGTTSGTPTPTPTPTP